MYIQARTWYMENNEKKQIPSVAGKKKKDFFSSRDWNQYLEQTTDSVITTLTANAQRCTASSGKRPQESPAGGLHPICCSILHHQWSLFVDVRAWIPPTSQLPKPPHHKHKPTDSGAKPPLLFCSLQCVSGADKMQVSLTWLLPWGIEITWISSSATAIMPSGGQSAWHRPNSPWITTNTAQQAGEHNLVTKSPQLVDTSAEKFTGASQSSQENKGMQSKASRARHLSGFPLIISRCTSPKSHLLLPNNPHLCIA